MKVFTYVKLWTETDEDLGQLLDISTQGIAFRYWSDSNSPKVYSELSLLLTDRKSVVSRIPFKTVSDITLNNGSASCPLIFRRAGVQFEKLTPYQKYELDDYLNNHILETAYL